MKTLWEDRRRKKESSGVEKHNYEQSFLLGESMWCKNIGGSGHMEAFQKESFLPQEQINGDKWEGKVEVCVGLAFFFFQPLSAAT